VKKLIIGLLIGSLLVGGCKAGTISPASENISSKAPTVTESVGPDNLTWVAPAKVEIGRFYPGARAEFYLTVHNGSEDSKQFTVSYLVPSQIRGDYKTAIEGVESWVTIEPSGTVFAPRETRQIFVAVEMPKDAEEFAENWEFWIRVKEDQSGMIQTELASRILVSMR